MNCSYTIPDETTACCAGITMISSNSTTQALSFKNDCLVVNNPNRCVRNIIQKQSCTDPNIWINI